MSPWLARPLFLATVVTGSFLLFLTQPMIGRMALPRLGGAPAVWNSAMLVYQALLLGGYAYAHWIAHLQPRLQAGLHLAAYGLAALWLPIGLVAAVPPVETSPVLWVPWFLIVSVGPLFFIISAQAPLMQRWYALDPARGEPYMLYAASNLGSFAGLLSYPLLVEPNLTLQEQSHLWTGCFALLVLLVALCALTVPARAAAAVEEPSSPPAGRRRIVQWILLAAVPSGLMLSTTTHLTTDIVAVPLIWALPLSLYLLSYVIAFAERRTAANFITQLAPLIVLIAGSLAFADGSRRPIAAAALGLSLLFFMAVTLHSEMYRLRPKADRLTGFYFAMSFGGVLGGAFCALLAPVLFDWIYEHPLLIAVGAALLPQQALAQPLRRIWAHKPYRRYLSICIPVIVLLLSIGGDRRFNGFVPEWLGVAMQAAIAVFAVFSIGRPVVFAACLAAMMMGFGGWSSLQTSWLDVRTRSYFGVYTVGTNAQRSTVTLTHGTTLHGVQSVVPGRVLEPTTYYVRPSGVGLAFSSAEVLYGPDAKMGVVGLGTGTLACYALPGQDWRFFEIDPAMVKLATKSGWFTFMRNCAPKAKIVLGDARLSLSREPPARLDMLAIDAFTSDAVPIHLLTLEAFEVYARALQPRGILLVHISNRYLDLRPVVAAAAARGGWQALLLDYAPEEVAPANQATGSTWIAMSRNQEALDNMLFASRAFAFWEELTPTPGFRPWTDDFASILPVLTGLTE